MTPLQPTTVPPGDVGDLSLRVRQLESLLGSYRDRLTAADRRYLSLLDACLEGILVHQDDLIRHVNPALLGMFRYSSAEELVGKPVWDIFSSPEAMSMLKERTARLLRGESVDLSPVWHTRRKDGSPIALQTRGTRIEWEGRPAVLANYLDVTNRVQAEEALRLSEERFRIMFEHMPVLIDAFDLDGRLVLWNRECERVTGYRAEEVIGRSDLLELLYPDPAYREQMLSEWSKRGADFHEREWTLRSKDGTPHTVAWSNIAARVPIPGWGSWAVGVDVTTRRQAESARRGSEERYRTLVQMMPHGVSEIDVEGNILFGNVAYHRIHGFEPGEMIGRTIYENYGGPGSVEELRERLQRLAREQPEPDFYPCWLTSRDGTHVDLEATWDYKRDAQGKVVGFVCVMTDVTARKKVEEERKRIDERLRETQKLESLGVLAGGIAHDFNNLLMTILGNADLARLQVKGDSAVRMHLDHIDRASQRAAELCRQMLAYAGRGHLRVTPLDLTALVKETGDLLRLTISKKVVLSLQLSSGLPAILADATQIRQVVLNLVMNASEAIGDRMGRITVALAEVLLDRSSLDATLFGDGLLPGHYVCLAVRDTGGGMSDEVRARIFEPFFTTKEAGRGLGLSAVIGIVRGHQGTMTIETVPQRGTTFQLYFPVIADAAVTLDETTHSPSWYGSGNALVVDDEEDVRLVARNMLDSLGFIVQTAGDGEEAVAIVRKDPSRFDIVLLDLTMPLLDGRQALELMWQIRPGLPVILTSGYTETEIRDMVLGTAKVEFLQKPFRRDELAKKVRSLLKREDGESS